ncbi:unnamed protein product [Closterium sp. Naga37s-1]|nr:unnamed protein product [Closterium sp. Naga37s-1]
MIRAIDKAAIHRICSGQVVLDVAGAVKELVENSLDAGATSVEVRLKDFGAELIEVADNGCGVAPPNWQALTLKYHTSKIAHFSDLQSLSSFGFRGEALSSLCALADVTITTRTANEPIATRLVFDHGGKLLPGPREQVARAVGTTVSVAKIFSPLPVRRREFERNVRREFAKLVSVLQAYCVVSTHARILCTNQSGRSSARTTVVQTAGTGSMRENIIAVFGAKAAAGLDPVDISFPLSPASAAAAPPAPATPSPAATGTAATTPAQLPPSCCTVTGFLSRPGAGSGRPAGDRQFFFLNGRLVDLPRLSKLLNELYRSFNSLQFPAAFLNVSLSADAYDVNVTPDKRKVFLHSEAALLSGLRAALSEFYSPDRGGCAIGDADDDGRGGGGDELNGEMDGDGQMEEAEGEGDRGQPPHQFDRGKGRGKATRGGAVEEAAHEEAAHEEAAHEEAAHEEAAHEEAAHEEAAHEEAAHEEAAHEEAAHEEAAHEEAAHEEAAHEEAAHEEAAHEEAAHEEAAHEEAAHEEAAHEEAAHEEAAHEEAAHEEAAHEEAAHEEAAHEEAAHEEAAHEEAAHEEAAHEEAAHEEAAHEEAAHEAAVGGLARGTGEAAGGRGEARKAAAGSGGKGGTAGGAAGAAGGGAGTLQWSESKAAAMRRLLLMSPQDKGKAKGKALGLGMGVGGGGGVHVGMSEDRGKDVTFGGGTADRRSLSRGAVSGGEQARAWQGYETRHMTGAERERDRQRAQQEEEEEAEAEEEEQVEAEEPEKEEEEEEEEEEVEEEEEEERESKGGNVGRRNGSSRAVRGGGQRSMGGVATQAQGMGRERIGRGRLRGESSEGVERAQGGADGRQVGLDAWLGKGVGGGRGGRGSEGGKMGEVDGGSVRGRAGDGWAGQGGMELVGKLVEREEDEDSEEVREVGQVEGEGGGMPAEKGENHDAGTNDAAQCGGVHAGLQEATRDEWAGKNVLDLPLMTQEMTQADLPELVGSQLLPGTQLAGQQESSAVADGAGKGRCCGGDAGELEGEEGGEGGEGGDRMGGIEAGWGAALGTTRVARSGEGWAVKGAEGSVQVPFDMRRVQQVWRRRAEIQEREAREESAGREGRRGVAGRGKGEGRRSFAAASVADGVSNPAHSSGGRKIQHEGEAKEAALEAAARELERRFDKRDFASMAVIGQFNLGFIIGRLGSDLFIVDQHASDEKFNFERLMRCTVLNKQPLLVPQRLDLSPAEEVIVSAHMPTFRSNGFHFSVDESAPSGRRFRLSAVPFSKNIVFGASDVCELISMLADAPLPDPESAAGAASVPDAICWHATTATKHAKGAASGAGNHQEASLHDNSASSPQPRRSEINNASSTAGGVSPRDGRSGAAAVPATSPSASPSTVVAVRPSQVRSMLASRACRSSVMIGTALSQAQMSKV